MLEAKCMHKSGLHLVGNGIHASNAKDIVRDDGAHSWEMESSLCKDKFEDLTGLDSSLCKRKRGLKLGGDGIQTVQKTGLKMARIGSNLCRKHD